MTHFDIVHYILKSHPIVDNKDAGISERILETKDEAELCNVLSKWGGINPKNKFRTLATNKILDKYYYMTRNPQTTPNRFS